MQQINQLYLELKIVYFVQYNKHNNNACEYISPTWYSPTFNVFCWRWASRSCTASRGFSAVAKLLVIRDNAGSHDKDAYNSINSATTIVQMTHETVGSDKCCCSCGWGGNKLFMSSQAWWNVPTSISLRHIQQTCFRGIMRMRIECQ